MTELNKDGEPRKKSGPKKGDKNVAVSKPRQKFDIPTMNKFLKRLEKTGNLLDAANYVGSVRDTVYKKMKKDPKFRERVELARERAVANYEKELDNRIYEGNHKDEFGPDGELIKRTTTKDNTLLVKALEANDREKWGKPDTSKGDTTVINVGDSAVSKLAAFLKVDLPAPEREVGKSSQDSLEDGSEEADWEEVEG